MAKRTPAVGPVPLVKLMMPLGRREPWRIVGSRDEENSSAGTVGFVDLLLLEVVSLRRSQYRKILPGHC